MPLPCLVNEFVCDYGKKDYFLVDVKGRDALNKFIDDTMKTSSSTSKNSTIGNGSQQTLNGGSPDPSSVSQESESKLKTIIIVAGVAIVVVGVLAVVLVLLCRKSEPEKNVEQRMSIESTGDLWLICRWHSITSGRREPTELPHIFDRNHATLLKPSRTTTSPSCLNFTWSLFIFRLTAHMCRSMRKERSR